MTTNRKPAVSVKLGVGRRIKKQARAEDRRDSPTGIVTNV